MLTCFALRYPDDAAPDFDGHPPHTHGDVVARLSGLPGDEAMQRHVDALLDNRSVVAVHTVGGRVKDIWTDDDPLGTSLNNFRPDKGELAFRFRDGTPATLDDGEQ